MQRCTAEQRVPTTCTVDGGYIGMKLALHPRSFKDTPSYPIQSNHISRLLSDLKKKKKTCDIKYSFTESHPTLVFKVGNLKQPKPPKGTQE